MLPIDHHAETGQKVKWAIKLAGIYGARVRVVAALSLEQKDRSRDKIRRQVENVHDQIKNAGIGCETEVLEAQAGEKDIVSSLLDYANRTGDIDLIIIMTQQESAIGWSRPSAASTWRTSRRPSASSSSASCASG